MKINLAISKGSKILRNKFIISSQLDSEILMAKTINKDRKYICLLYTSPSPRDRTRSRMPSSA